MADLKNQLKDLQDEIEKLKANLKERHEQADPQPLRTYSEEKEYVNKLMENDQNPFKEWAKPRREVSVMCKIADISWHPDSKRVLCVSQDGTILVQDMYMNCKEFFLYEDDAFLMTCSFDSHDGSMFAVSGLSNLCMIYKPSEDTTGGEGAAPSKVLKGHEGYISGVGWLNKGECVTSSGDHTNNLWDIEKGKVKHTFYGHEEDVSCLTTFKNDTNIFVTGSNDHSCRVWDKRAPPPNCVSRYYTPAIVNDIKSLKVPDNYLFGCSTEGGAALLFDLRTRHQLQKFEDHEEDPTSFKKIEFSHSGKYCFAGGNDGYVFIFDTLTAEDYMPVAVMPSEGAPIPVSGLAVSPDGTALCAAVRSTVMKVFA